MSRTRTGVSVVVVAASILVTSIAFALTPTRTNGLICRDEPCHVETFSGGYIFKGVTHPSVAGQKVVFEYKRAGKARWHRFGKPNNDRKVFISLDGTTSDLINADHEWREHFDINGFVGYPRRRWVLRARFLPQGGKGGSSEWVHVRAAYGD